MQGDITVNGKKMTMTEFVELFFETEDKVKERDLQIKKLQKELDELETELRVKEELFKIKSGLKSEEFSEIVSINGENKKLTYTEKGTVKIGNLPYIEESRPSIEWYEERHQSDCITINQLHTTIDVLTDKITNLRKNMGLC